MLGFAFCALPNGAGLVANKISQEANKLWKCPRIKGAAEELRRALDLKAGPVERLMLKRMDEKRDKESPVNIHSTSGFQLLGIHRSYRTSNKSLLFPVMLLHAPESQRAPKGSFESGSRI